MQKLLIFGAVIVAIAIMWYVVQVFQTSPAANGSAARLFQTDFTSAISDQVTGTLISRNTTRPAEVTLEELGEFSPVAGMVEIVPEKETLAETDRQHEYITIRARSTNAQPVNISNWSLQSMISDTWIGLPQGVELYVAGEVNERADIYLHPGESAIIATKASPVGVSFRVNRCSGFLGSTQRFEPSLRTLCIAPGDVVPPTVENIREYGDSCVRFVENFDRCTYVTGATATLDGLTQACRERIQPRLTYNYCTGVHSEDSDFYSEREWRVFLNQPNDLWRENYEVVRLLDEKHRTVDVFNY